MSYLLDGDEWFYAMNCSGVYKPRTQGLVKTFLRASMHSVYTDNPFKPLFYFRKIYDTNYQKRYGQLTILYSKKIQQ